MHLFSGSVWLSESPWGRRDSDQPCRVSMMPRPARRGFLYPVPYPASGANQTRSIASSHPFLAEPRRVVNATTGGIFVLSDSISCERFGLLGRAVADDSYHRGESPLRRFVGMHATLKPRRRRSAARAFSSSSSDAL